LSGKSQDFSDDIDTSGNGPAVGSADDRLLAIDVLLEPDRSTMDRTRSINTRLRENYQAGYALDASHPPHVTLLQRFVRAKDLDTVKAAIGYALEGEDPTFMMLKATRLDYVRFAGLAVAVLVVEPTPELVRLHDRITDAVAVLSISGGGAAAFVGGDAVAGTVDWVETYVPKASGKNYSPHITAGIATEGFLKQLRTEPFEPLAFRSDALAVFQIGNFGTAAKRLWKYQPDPKDI
jgi:hypothetical protein